MSAYGKRLRGELGEKRCGEQPAPGACGRDPSVVCFRRRQKLEAQWAGDDFSLAFARIENHYFTNRGFLRGTAGCWKMRRLIESRTFRRSSSRGATTLSARRRRRGSSIGSCPARRSISRRRATRPSNRRSWSGCEATTGFGVKLMYCLLLPSCPGCCVAGLLASVLQYAS